MFTRHFDSLSTLKSSVLLPIDPDSLKINSQSLTSSQIDNSVTKTNIRGTNLVNTTPTRYPTVKPTVKKTSILTTGKPSVSKLIATSVPSKYDSKSSNKVSTAKTSETSKP